MNKKQILKEQKRIKEERKQVQNLFNDEKDVYNVFKIGLGVILFILLAFACINIMNGNWNLFSKNNIKQEEIDNSMVMVGTMFNKEDGKYLVLAYDMSDKNNAFYAALTENYYDETKLYYLDLSSGFNRDFVGENANITNDLSKLKFSGPTLLLINKDKIEKSYITEKEIVNYFK